MFRPIRSRRPGRPATDSRATTPTPFARRLRVEPLEDRRMLSLTLFVDVDAAPGGDGLAWETAYTDLQSALDSAAALNADAAAENDVDAIWIAEGTYLPSAELEPGVARSASFSLLDGVTLYGGFAGTEETLGERNPDPTLHETVLSGDIGIAGNTADNAYTVVYCGDSVTAGMDRVTVRQGNANGTSDGAPIEVEGGGICIDAGVLTLVDATIVENSAAEGGGAIWSTGTLNASRVVLSRNTATDGLGLGGAIHCVGGTLNLTSSTLFENIANYGGGIFNDGGSIYIGNSVLARNESVGKYGSGGGLHHVGMSAPVTIVNSIIAENTATWWGEGGGIYSELPAIFFRMRNTLVAKNRAHIGMDIHAVFASDWVLNCLVGDGSGLPISTDDDQDPATGSNNIVGTAEEPIDPRFGDWSLMDNGRWGYYLLEDSPALDAGDSAMAVDSDGRPFTEDAYGRPRIQGATVDIGAIEGATSTLPGRTYVVNSLADVIEPSDGLLTFMEAFLAAQTNQPAGDAPAGAFDDRDVIRFAEGVGGTVLVDDGELWINGDLTIEGPGADFLTFDAQSRNRVFHTVEETTFELSGATITGGSDDTGGAIRSLGTLIVSNARFLDNYSTGSGGAIQCLGGEENAPSMISNCVFRNNNTFSSGSGGAVSTSGAMDITDSVFSENSANSGGAISSSGSPLNILRCTFERNTGNGGGLRASGTVTIEESSFVGNFSSAGGAVSCGDGTLRISNSNFLENTAERSGGAIEKRHGELIIENSTFAGNTGHTDGGAIYLLRPTVSISGSTFVDNTAGNYGGAVAGARIDGDGTITVRDSVFSRNMGHVGGAFYVNAYTDPVTLSIAGSVLSANHATKNGGAIYCYGQSSHARVNLTGSILYDNSAAEEGGAVMSWGGGASVYLKNSTLYGNAAPCGGGIRGESKVFLDNSIVAGNIADEGSDFRMGYGISVSGKNNLIGDGSYQLLTHDDDGDPAAGTNNLVGTHEHPIDPQFGDWTQFDNGLWGYYLLPESPAVNAGDDALAVDEEGNTLLEDLSGGPRIRDGAVDIGAVEGGVLGPDARTYVVTSLEDVIDAEDAKLTFAEAFEAAQRNQPVGDAPAGSYREQDVIRFVEGLFGTVALHGEPLTIIGGLVIDGPGADRIAFDGGEQSGVFVVHRDAAFKLGAVTVTGGSADSGAGIHNSGVLNVANRATITGNSASGGGGGIYNRGIASISDVTIEGNSASDGSGVLNGGTMTIEDTLILKNLAENRGGGIKNLTGGALVLTGSTVLANWASEHGGGLFNAKNATASVTGATFAGNNAAERGGGACSFGVFRIEETTFDANSAIDGGGVWSNGVLDVVGATFQRNSASGSGGGICEDGGTTLAETRFVSNWSTNGGGVWAQGDVTVGDCVFQDNFASENGGAVGMEYADVSVDDSLLRENEAVSRGGGIYVRIANLVMSNSKIEHGTAAHGAGVYVDSYGDVTVDASTISGNIASANGGGIYCTDAITVTNSILEANVADDGAAAWSDDSIDIAGSTIRDNTARRSGGGLAVIDGHMKAANSGFFGNTAANDGGAMWNAGRTVALTNIAFTTNRASRAGAVFNDAYGRMTGTGLLFVGNSAETNGGGIVNNGLLEFANVTIAGNAALVQGGGLDCDGEYARTQFDNALVALNDAPVGPELRQAVGTFLGAHNLISDGSGQSSLTHGTDGNLVGTTESPIDPRFVRNPSDGGDGWGDDPTTPNIDESANDDFGDLRLLPDSPAINGGDNALLPADTFDLDADGNVSEPLPVDLAGGPRVQNGIVDMGAYERFVQPVFPADLNRDGFVGSGDLDLVRANWGQTVQPWSLLDGDATGDGIVNSDDLDVVRANWGRVPLAAGVADAANPQEATFARGTTYGPLRPSEAPAGAEGATGALFAARRELAEAAWMAAVDGLKTRRKERTDRAVDAVMLQWKAR